MNRLLRVLAATCVGCIGANADIVATFEAAGVENTTQAGIPIVETFESATPGNVFSGASPVGTYSAGGEIVKASDVYGSSTNYLTMGLYGTGTTTVPGPPYSYTLSLGDTFTYFGFYWAAVDGDDSVSFYKGGSLVKTFTSALFSGIDASYFVLNGAENPPTTKEPYAFVNFNANGGDSFDSVVFTNGGSGTGFETDNHTILADSKVGVDAVPEPATLGLVGASLVFLAIKRRKRNSNVC